MALWARWGPDRRIGHVELSVCSATYKRCLMAWRHEIGSLECNEAVELVTDFLEGDLDPHAEPCFTHHVPGCSEYLSQVSPHTRSHPPG